MATTPTRLGVTQVIIGGYTAQMAGSAVGISTLAVSDTVGGEHQLTALQELELESPTYLIMHPSEPWLFAVGESDPGRLTSLALSTGGSLRATATVETGGSGPCHLALSPDGRYLLVANYASGSVSSFELSPDGTVNERSDLLQFTGSGPNHDRQEGPHAHQVVFVDAEVLVCDLGTDRVHRLALDDAGMLRRAADPIHLPPGSGPRHLVRIGDYLVVACELSAELWLGRRTDDGWEQAQMVGSTTSTLTTSPSGIVADGDRVFVANRGPGTIGVFDLDPSLGSLVPIAEFGCGGVSPRDIVLGHGYLWVANQTNDVVSVFRNDPAQATVELEFASPSPASIVLLSQNPWGGGS